MHTKAVAPEIKPFVVKGTSKYSLFIPAGCAGTVGFRLIIGKFCAIARDVKFIMNGANHKMDAFEWWNWPIEKITENLEALISNDESSLGRI